jgi:hypothetical protein
MEITEVNQMAEVLQGENSITYNEATMNAIVAWWLNNNQFGKAVGGEMEVVDIEQIKSPGVGPKGGKVRGVKTFKVTFKPKVK